MHSLAPERKEHTDLQAKHVVNYAKLDPKPMSGPTLVTGRPLPTKPGEANAYDGYIVDVLDRLDLPTFLSYPEYTYYEERVNLLAGKASVLTAAD